MRQQRRLAAILAADVVGFSRLMGVDEGGTLRALKTHMQEVIEPAITHHTGRIVKTTGDGILAEFASVLDAITAALAIQHRLQARNQGVAEDRRMVLRMGLNIGDVVVDGSDILGDGVNLAARLEAISPPGGIAMATSVYEQVRDRLNVAFTDLGEQTVKNFVRPVRVYGVTAEAIAAMSPPMGQPSASSSAPMDQQIRFCRAADGVELAWSVIGSGPPLIKAGTWMTHLEKDLDNPIWRQLWRDLAKHFSLVRYDARGIGLSQRQVDDISFDAFARDLETVIEATGEKRFALLGISQGCAVSAVYAAKYPERVSHLVLYGGFALGFDKVPSSAAAKARRDALLVLMQHGWDKKDNAAFRQLFTSQFAPDASKEQADWFNELERISTSPENVVRYLRALYDLDATAYLPRIQTPTLVLHAEGDMLVPFEAGRRMAAAIPGARLVTLASRNHILLSHEPAYARFIEEVLAFLRG